MNNVRCKGDPHNFGNKTIKISPSKIYKPRSIFWEFFFLGKNSQFRIELDFFINRLTNREIQLLWPKLDFTINNNFFRSGFVDMLEVKDLNRNLSQVELVSIGFSIATLFWLGIGDLHQQNIMFGVHDGKLIFGPIDIEEVLRNYLLLSQTQLILDHRARSNYSGLLKLKDFFFKNQDLNGLIAILNGFKTAMELFMKKDEEITQIINSHNIENIPIRLVIHDTSQYYDYLNNQNKFQDVSFSNCELEQLARGDIPYYFYFLNDDNIYYLDKPNSPVKSKVPNEILSIYKPIIRDFKYGQLQPRYFPEGYLEFCLAQLTKYFFNDCADVQEYESNNIKISISEKEICYKDSKFNFLIKRDL